MQIDFVAGHGPALNGSNLMHRFQFSGDHRRVRGWPDWPHIRGISRKHNIYAICKEDTNETQVAAITSSKAMSVLTYD